MSVPFVQNSFQSYLATKKTTRCDPLWYNKASATRLQHHGQVPYFGFDFRSKCQWEANRVSWRSKWRGSSKTSWQPIHARVSHVTKNLETYLFTTSGLDSNNLAAARPTWSAWPRFLRFLSESLRISGEAQTKASPKEKEQCDLRWFKMTLKWCPSCDRDAYPVLNPIAENVATNTCPKPDFKFFFRYHRTDSNSFTTCNIINIDAFNRVFFTLTYPLEKSAVICWYSMDSSL